MNWWKYVCGFQTGILLVLAIRWLIRRRRFRTPNPTRQMVRGFVSILEDVVLQGRQSGRLDGLQIQYKGQLAEVLATFLLTLGQARGKPSEVLDALERLLKRRPDEREFHKLRRIAEWLESSSLHDREIPPLDLLERLMQGEDDSVVEDGPSPG